MFTLKLFRQIFPLQHSDTFTAIVRGTRLGEFFNSLATFCRLIGIFETKRWPKKGDTFGYKFISFSAKQAV
jgi:hypothetical protein